MSLIRIKKQNTKKVAYNSTYNTKQEWKYVKIFSAHLNEDYHCVQ